ncbi:methyl-accepting chemotaxis protein [Cohnella algarum]|uniref:methyl-accepting chemotaxis protein n=1 Tax=Cohnella algarum TaxID=2044859 RepID=UPI001966F535|nr:methyl-accepting chemotaxis protein [Cohnella algarum]MBN2982324.1 methyl-accepting chemotaxis protein [Cohnella algarum]
MRLPTRIKPFLPDFRSIRFKLTAVLLVLTLLPMSLVSSVLYMKSSGMILEKVGAASAQSVRQAVEKVEVQLAQYDRLALQLMMDSDVQEALNAVGTNQGVSEKVKRASDRTKELIAPLKEIAGTYYITSDERLESQLPLFYRVPEAERNNDLYASIQEAGGKTVYFGIAPSINSDLYLKGSPVIVLGKALKQLSGNRTVGIILMEIRSESLLQTLEDLKLHKDSEAFFVDEQGNVVAHRDMARIGEPSPISSGRPDEGQTVVGGKKSIASSHASAMTAWTLMTATPIEFVTRDIADLRIWIVICALAAALASSAVSFLAARRISRPLDSLMVAMREAEDGDLTVCVPVRGTDELARVAGSFNRMLHNIRSLLLQTKDATSAVLSAATTLEQVSARSAMTTGELVAATAQIAAGSMQQAEAAEAGYQKTRDLHEQMDSLKSVASHIRGMADAIRDRSLEGTTYMGQMTAKNKQSEAMLAGVFERINMLAASILSIRKVIVVMDGIMKKTNILSLNAGIEAARAGAVGKGFMVIADEIRQLAAQAKLSIEQVEGMIGGIQQEMNETTEFLNAAKPIFVEQHKSVSEATTVFRHMESSIGEFHVQLGGLEQSVHTLEEVERELQGVMSHVAGTSQETSASTEEMASGTEEQKNVTDRLVSLSVELKEMSERLQASVRTFTV